MGAMLMSYAPGKMLPCTETANPKTIRYPSPCVPHVFSRREVGLGFECISPSGQVAVHASVSLHFMKWTQYRPAFSITRGVNQCRSLGFVGLLCK